MTGDLIERERKRRCVNLARIERSFGLVSVSTFLALHVGRGFPSLRNLQSVIGKSQNLPCVFASVHTRDVFLRNQIVTFIIVLIISLSN